MLIGILQGIAIIILFTVVTYIYDKNNSSKLYQVLFYLIIALIIESIGMFMQLLFAPLVTNISPICYEYFADIGAIFAPTLFLMFAFLYNNYKTNLSKFYAVFVIDILLLILLWTNKYHQMFFKFYSMDYAILQAGFIYYIFRITYYFQLFLGIFILIRASYRKSGFLSLQTLLIITGYMLPAIPTFMYWGGIISVPRYIAPILYMGSILCILLSVIKLRALDIIPVAQDTIMDTMSDAFVIIGLDGTMTDMNKIFEEKFGSIMQLSKNSNIFDIVKRTNIKEFKKIPEIIQKSYKLKKNILDEIHIVKDSYESYFQIESSPIKEKRGKNFISTLLLFRDVTLQKKEVEILINNENLAIIGELAGGIAHDINTPITAIRSGLLVLNCRLNNKDKDEKMIIESMTNSAEKISVLVNSLRNQMRNLGSTEDIEINLGELVQDLQVIMYSELIKNKIRININAPEEVKINGSLSKMTQVINNIINNSIKAYKGEGGMIDINISDNKKEEAIITIEDFAGGIDEKLVPYIFKSVIATSTSPSIGVGLYLAYSIIQGSFKGSLSFESKTKKGTKFTIKIPKKI